MNLDQIVERLRASGLAPVLMAEAGAEPPGPLKSPPPPATRQVGRRTVLAELGEGGRK